MDAVLIIISNIREKKPQKVTNLVYSQLTLPL